VRVCAASKFLAQLLAPRPRLVDLLASALSPATTPLRTSDLNESGALARRLRRHKQAEVLRIALRDLTGASFRR